MEPLGPCEYSGMNSQIFGQQSSRSRMFKHWDFEGLWVYWWCFSIVSSYMIPFFESLKFLVYSGKGFHDFSNNQEGHECKKLCFWGIWIFWYIFFVIVLSHMINFLESLGPRDYSEVSPGFLVIYVNMLWPILAKGTNGPQVLYCS